MDKKGGGDIEKQSAFSHELTSLCEEYSLTDIWRVRNPNKKPKRELCDATLSLNECTAALKQLANNKSPGSDCFTTNFYKVFWIDQNDLIYNSSYTANGMGD